MQAINDTIEASCVIVFLYGLNHDRYQDLLDELTNSYLNGRDEYPRTLVLAFTLVTERRGGIKTPRNSNTNDGVAFNTDVVDSRVDENSEHVNTISDMLMRKDGTTVNLFICGENNYTNNCPNKKSLATYSKTLTDKDTPATDTGIQHVTLGDDS